MRLLGAAEALRQASNSARTPKERIEYDQEVAGLRAGLDEETFDLLWAEGQSMNMEQAVEFAMGETEG